MASGCHDQVASLRSDRGCGVAEGAGDDSGPATDKQSGETPVPAIPRKASFADFLAELKRRRVFRVMVGYGIFAFAVLQVIEPIMHGAGLPDWVLKAVLVALAVGFPVALVLAWLFDLTAQGVTRTPAALGVRGIQFSRARLAVLLVVVGLLGALPGIGWYFWKQASERGMGETTSATPSIAVLPFADMSEKHDQEYFADGVAEEILNALAHVEGLRVIGRTSSFSFKGKPDDLRVIGQKLGVSSVLEGSLRRSHDQIRIKAQLIRVSDGSHLWSETYERKVDDVFKVQDEIGRAVVAALAPRLVHAPRRPGRQTSSLEAHDLYLRGLYLWNQRTGESLLRAADMFRQSIVADPGYALAHVGLALALALYPEYAWTPPGEYFEQAKASARRALELDPSLGEAHAVLGNVLVDQLDYAGGLAEMEQALRLSPDLPTARQWHAEQLCYLGRIAECRAEFARALTLDPTSRIINVNAGRAAVYARDYPAAERAFRRTLELAPEFDRARVFLAEVLALQGRPEEALEQASRIAPNSVLGADVAAIHARCGRLGEARRFAAELEVQEQRQFVPPGVLARIWAAVGDGDRAFGALRTVCDQRDGSWLDALKVDPVYDALHDDPRWEKILACLHLP
jgi:TolB-like protein/Flp pilus assembly protein TadD